MYKEIFLLAFISSCMLTVDSTPIVCDELLRLFDDKSTRRGSTLGRIRNAINRACTALDLLRHGINPLDLLAASDDVTKRTRRTKKTTTEATTAAAPPTTPVPSNEHAANFPSTTTPLEVILKHPQVNIFLGNHTNDINSLRTSNVQSRTPSSRKFDTRVAVDAPRHLLPLDFNPHELKRPYPAVYEVRTKFACDQQPYNPGVYADMSLGCKANPGAVPIYGHGSTPTLHIPMLSEHFQDLVFHLCASTDPYHNRTSFYCPDTLLFNQEMLRCDYPKNVNCHESYKTFPINENFNKKFDIKYVILGKVN